MENLQSVHWQLSVLSKAIHYKNLSGAAAHVGLSQPQLSRIIARLEEELGVVLLDRTARRKSGWTPVAFKVADTYFRSSRKLTQAIQQLTTDNHITHVSIGLLEGLIPLASEFCRQLFQQPRIQQVELNVYDLSELEERFEKDELDLIFTMREPGKHKYKNVRNLGFQQLQKVGTSGNGPRVLSTYDFSSQASRRSSGRSEKLHGHVLISNSLAIRKLWIDEHGGSGQIPSEVRRKRVSEEDVPVVLIASDLINPALWQKLEQIEL